MLLVLVSLATALAGATDVSHCPEIEDDLKRLACFDAATRTRTTSTATPGAWDVERETNPMDDTTTITATLRAGEVTGHERGKAVGLVARCSSSGLKVYIGWQDYLGLDQTDVTVRIGTMDAATEAWKNDTSNEASFSPAPYALLESMVGETKFAARVVPYNSTPVLALFTVTGIDGIREELVAACPRPKTAAERLEESRKAKCKPGNICF